MMRVLLLLGLLLVVGSPAHAVDVSQLSDFEADPCFVALNERNVAQHVDAPDSALADACERGHGNAEVAWDFLTRTWLPRDVGTSSAFAAAAAPLGGLVAALAVLQMLLAYVVLGSPVWSIRLALGAARAVRPRRLAAEAALSLLARLLLGTALLTLLALPLAPLLGALVALAAIAWTLRPALRRASVPDEIRPSALAEILAGAINDIAAAAPGLLVLALAARGHWRLLALGVLLSVLVSLPPVARALRVVARQPLAFAGAAALLAFGLGAIAVSGPRLAAFGGGAVGYVVPIAFVAVVLWRARLLDRLPGRRRAFGG